MTISAERVRAGLSQWARGFFADMGRIFQIPFVGLPLIIWSYFVIAYVALPNNIWRGNFLDPDDYTYLTQTLDWLKGQGWFDAIQHRMNAPEGVAIHFTRFAQLPIAGLIVFFRALNYSWQGAATLTAFLLPLLYLALFFYVLRHTADRFVSPTWSRLGAFIAVFASGLMSKFAPSQVDHHALEIILITGSIGLLAKTFETPIQKRWPIAAGVLLALSTAIALEALPWMILASATLGLWTALTGPKAAKPTLLFGLTLATTGAICLLLDKPFPTLFEIQLLSYSFAYVLLMAGIALALAIAALSARIPNLKGRLVVSTVGAAALGIAYLTAFPQLLAGPYGAMDPRLAELFFANVSEAVPALKNLSTGKASQSLLLALAIIASISAFRNATAAKKWSWILLTTFLATAFALTLFYQTRLIVYAQAFSIIPLIAFTENRWHWIAKTKEGRGRFWAELGLVTLIGPLFNLLIPAVQDGRSFNTGILMFPTRISDDPCDLAPVVKALNQPPYAGRTLRIVNTINQGPGLLFYTPHHILSAPYHTNVHGNLTAQDFFSTKDENHARQIAQKENLDLVVLCKYVPTMYLEDHSQQEAAVSQKLLIKSSDTTLAAHLATGNAPSWLKEIPLKNSWVALYEITPTQKSSEK